MGESQSEGIMERAVGLVAGQARTLQAALEHRIGTRIPPGAWILCWLLEFAASLMNRSLQRLHGRRDNTPFLEFRDKILYMPATPARGSKWEPRFHPGSLSACRNRRQRQWLSPSRDWRSRRGQRTSGGFLRRRDVDSILGIRIVPWPPDGSDNAFDFQVGTERPAKMVPRALVLMENKVARTQLRRADFERWGLSEDCPGCQYVRIGQERQQAQRPAEGRSGWVHTTGCG